MYEIKDIFPPIIKQKKAFYWNKGHIFHHSVWFFLLSSYIPAFDAGQAKLVI